MRSVVVKAFAAFVLVVAPACLVVETSSEPSGSSGFTGIGAKVTCLARSACDGEPWSVEVGACAPDVIPSDYVQAKCDAFVRDACPSRSDERGVLCDVDCSAASGLCRLEEIDFSAMTGGEGP